MGTGSVSWGAWGAGGQSHSVVICDAFSFSGAELPTIELSTMIKMGYIYIVQDIS